MLIFTVILAIVFINLLIMLMFRAVEPRKTYEELAYEKRREASVNAADVLLRRAH